MAFSLVSLLLQVECDDATAERLRTIVREFEGNFNPDMLPLETINIYPANVPLARELEALARKRYPDMYLEWQPDPVFEPNYLLAEGKVDEALHKLVDIYFDGRLPSTNRALARDPIGFIRGFYPQLVAGNELALIDILNSRDLSSPGQIRQRSVLLVRLYRQYYGADPQRLLPLFVDLLDTDPGNHELLQLVSGIRALTGQRFAAQELRRTQLSDTARAGVDGASQAVLRASLRGALELDHPIDAVAYGNALGLGVAVPAAETGPAAVQQPVGSLDAFVRALNGEDPDLLTWEAERLWQRIRLSEWTLLQESNGTHVNLRDVVQTTVNPGQVAAALMQGQENAPDLKTMLSVLAEHPLGVEILENWVGSVRGRLLERAQPLVEALADAHVNKGTAVARFAGLGAAIRERRAGDKEIGLWLAIGSRAPGLASGDDADAALAAYLTLETTYRPSLLFALAEFLAARGNADGALRGFKSLIHWVHKRTSGDLSSINEVLLSARKTLDATTYRYLLRDVFDRVRPREDYLLPAYSEFVLSHFDSASDRQAFSQTFGEDIDAAMQVLVGADEFGLRSMYVAVMEYRRDESLAALDGLQQAMEARVSLMNARFSGPTLGYAAAGGVSLEQQNSSFDAGLTANRSDSLGTRVILAMRTSKGDLPGLLFSEVDTDWLRRADVSIRGRIEAGEIDRNLGIEMLLSVARSYRELGADAEMERLFVDVKAELANDDVTLPTAAAVAAAAEELGQDLNDVQLEKELFSTGAIEPGHMAAVLRRIAVAEGEAAALDIGAPVLEFTLNDSLMDELIALADSNSRPAQAEEWRSLQREARLARAELDRTKALTRVF